VVPFAPRVQVVMGCIVTAILTADQLAELRQIDSATIANAIEPFDVRDKTEGYLGSSVRCLFSDFAEPMVGYAVTVKGDSTTYARRRDPSLQMELWEILEKAPTPSVVVIQDGGNNPAKSCHCGDVMATIIKSLGGVGVVTDGGVRDLAEVRDIGIQYFARGVTVSHGTAVLYEAGEPVIIDGTPIKTGDLIHGDANGVVVIPDAIAGQVVEGSRKVLAEEAGRKEFARQPGFTAAKYREFTGL